MSEPGRRTTLSAASARRRLLPTVRPYDRSWLGADVLAGLSAGAVVVPQAMAYATIANLPVQVGLYTCIVPTFVYAVLGSSRALSVSSTSTVATLTATTLVSAGVAASSPSSQDIPGDLVTLTLLVGVVLGLARLLRLGSLVEFINRPMLIGIQVGVGSTVAVGQLPKLLGEQANPSGLGFVRSIDAAVEALPKANLPTILLSAGSIAALLVLRRWLPRIPGPLLVAAAGIVLAATGSLQSAGVRLISPVPQGFPTPALPSFEHLGVLVPGALAIAVMAFLESTAAARATRDPGDRSLDTNQELLALSAANLVGGLFLTLPAGGGLSQSAVNKAAGARTQVSSMVTAGLAALVGLFLASVLSLLPEATLASLVFVSVLGLVRIGALRELWRISRHDFWIAIVTTVVGLTAGLLQAVAAGVVLTLVLVLQALNKPRVHVVDERDSVVRVRLGGPLYTANATGTEDALLALATGVTGLRVLVLDLSVVEEVSVTVLDMLTDLDRELAGSGVELRVTALPSGAAEVAERTVWFRRLRNEGRVLRDRN